MRQPIDYPAAHSMDTTWFAVDSDGCVGRFSSSEDGAVPMNAACAGCDAENFDSFELDARRAAELLADSYVEPPPSAPDPAVPPPHAARAIFVVTSNSGEPAGGYRDTPPQSRAEALVPADARVVLREREPRVLAAVKPLDPAIFSALSAHPDVLELWDEDSLHELLHQPEGRDGLFAFNHNYSGGPDPGAYRRSAAPARPVKLDELPAAMQEQIGAVRLPVRFEQIEELHLADHLHDNQVRTWGNVPLRYSPEAAAAAADAAARAEQERALEARQARNVLIALFVFLALLLATGILVRL